MPINRQTRAPLAPLRLQDGEGTPLELTDIQSLSRSGPFGQGLLTGLTQ